ncbi:reverse transcriptase domain-containing protein [Paenibacillus ginsengarvi]|uniref:reverse transcriptase domain-containing protein n=1 Tax=Paenibacillus ginsengarvi TaxID=400777 RepID=UPI001F0262D6|nr:reverse transcriptase domain-containing protein [Paenibacillus ginsengarvi]
MRISDRRVLKLGTPQGGVISPLLANIYLNYFERLWEKHGKEVGELMRYADDSSWYARQRRTRCMPINSFGRSWSV